MTTAERLWCPEAGDVFVLWRGLDRDCTARVVSAARGVSVVEERSVPVVRRFADGRAFRDAYAGRADWVAP